MIFVPIWPKNDIRLEEHDFSNFLFFPDRLWFCGSEHFWREKNIYSDFWHGSKRLRTPANAIKATKDEIRVALLPILVSWPAKNMYVVDKLQSTDYEKLLQCVSSSF